MGGEGKHQLKHRGLQAKAHETCQHLYLYKSLFCSGFERNQRELQKKKKLTLQEKKTYTRWRSLKYEYPSSSHIRVDENHITF